MRAEGVHCSPPSGPPLTSWRTCISGRRCIWEDTIQPYIVWIQATQKEASRSHHVWPAPTKCLWFSFSLRFHTSSSFWETYQLMCWVIYLEICFYKNTIILNDYYFLTLVQNLGFQLSDNEQIKTVCAASQKLEQLPIEVPLGNFHKRHQDKDIILLIFIAVRAHIHGACSMRVCVVDMCVPSGHETTNMDRDVAHSLGRWEQMSVHPR